MNVEVGVHPFVDLVQEGYEVLSAVPCLASSDHFAGCNVERGKKVQRSVAYVVVGLPLGLPEVHRKNWLRAFERLDLRFLVEREDNRVVGWVRVQPNNIAHLG